MSLNDIADRIEEEWYGSPKLHDLHGSELHDPQPEERTEGQPGRS